MTRSAIPQLLLITDDTAEESHTSHILAKYHFTNSLVIVRKGAEALKYFAACNAPDRGPDDDLPEAIILSIRESGRLNLSLAMESRRGALAAIPLIVVTDSREEEDEIRKLGFVRTTSISRPIGFFKLLEAMQKLSMRWIVLRPSS